MSQIEELVNQSYLAFAAYADFSGDPTGYIDALINAGMTGIQADHFLSSWTIVTQYTDESGVSATVFRDVYGKCFLAVRGTQPTDPLDFVSDYILARGFPEYFNPQYIDLRSQVSQWLSDGTLTSGFSVAGHSLGGYLAVAIGTCFSEQSNGIYTYNAPGLGGVYGNIADAVDEFRTFFGFSNTTVIDDITNVRGTAGLSLISGIGAQLAPPLSIGTESSLNPIANHSIVGIIDSLEVANLYNKLDSSIDIAKYNSLFQAASSTSGTSLEAMLDALRNQFGFISRTPNNNRTQFYTNLYVLQEEGYFRTLQGQVNIQLATSSLENTAKTQFSALVSLLSLSPLVLNGLSQESQAMLDTRLRMTWGEDIYSKWLADQALTAQQRAAGQANFSDQYLHDRAAMLSWLVEGNKGDIKTLISTECSDEWVFTDTASKVDITVRNFRSTTAHQVSFGDASGNSIKGGGTNDYLYGGGGDDKLDGAEGNDYIEGGTGDDTLTGGKGNDFLYGGAGFDTYIYNVGDGNDTIVDSDKKGRIIVHSGADLISVNTLYRNEINNVWTDASRLLKIG